jgi:hypothetical protein
MENKLSFKVIEYPNKKQLQIEPKEFDEGVKFAQKNDIKSVMVYCGIEKTEKYITIDFSWLKKLPELQSLEIMAPLSKKSNVDGIYELKKLKDLHYSHYDNVPLDHNKLKSLEHLYCHYSKNHKREECSFELLKSLKSLKLWSIKEEEDCRFIGKLNKLTRLELTWSRSIKSLDGLEEYKLLEILWLRNLSQLEDISALDELKGIKKLWIENCKRINEKGTKKLTMFRKNIYTNGY